MADTEVKGIPVGSGYIYETVFSGTIPENNVIETDANRLGYIEKGATLTYKSTFKKFKDDMGHVARNVLTDEEVTFKFGLISWVYSKLDALCSTCRITEKDGGRTVKIGGVGNDDGLRHLFRFVHPDKQLGDVRITIIGTNTGGLSLKYAADDSTNIEPEISAEPSDDEGTLVLLDIEDPITSLGTLAVTSIAGSTTGTTKITVLPSLLSGDSYKYKTGTSLVLPAFKDITSTGYTSWDGTSEITATSGNDIVIVEVDGSGLVKKAGKATVIAKA